jgi:hypothetical protein
LLAFAPFPNFSFLKATARFLARRFAPLLESFPMRCSRLLLSLAATSALFGASAFSVSSVFAQDDAPAAEAKAPEVDESVFDVPEGKDEAFYKQRLTEISEALALFRKTNPDAAAFNEFFLKRNTAMMTCYKYMSEIADLDANVRARYFSQYVDGLAFFGKLDEINALLAAEEAKETPDASRLNTLKFASVSAAVDKAVQANDEAEIKKLATDLIAKGKTDDFWASRAPSILEDLASSKPSVGLPFLRDICAAYAASDDESRKKIAERYEGKIRFADLVGNEMKVEGLYLDGKEIDWASYRGKVVWLQARYNFKTTTPFALSIKDPQIAKYKEIYAKYADAGLAVLEYNIDLKAPSADDKSSVPEAGYPILSRRLSADAEKDYADFAALYLLDAAGRALLIDVDGKVVSVRPKAADLEKLLKERFPNVK